MKRIGIISVMLLTALAACKHAARHVPLLTVIQDNGGDSIRVDDFLSITYSEKTEDGQYVSGSYEYDVRPTLLFREKSYFKGDFFDMIGHLSEGDSARFKINIDSIAHKMKRVLPAGIKGKYLVYDVKINKTIARGKLNDSAYNVAIETYRKQMNDAAMQAEQAKLDKYISKNKLRLQKTASGLMYIVNQKGTGALPNIQDTVLVSYIAKTLTGKIYEATDAETARSAGVYVKGKTYGPVKVPVLFNRGNLSGFLESLAMFPKGTNATLILPSKLAYGAANYKMLQPYTPLICEMEIVDVIPAKK